MVIRWMLWGLVACAGNGGEGCGGLLADDASVDSGGDREAEGGYCLSFEVVQSGGEEIIESGFIEVDEQGRTVLEIREDPDRPGDLSVVTTAWDDEAGTYTVVEDFGVDSRGEPGLRRVTTANAINDAVVSTTLDQGNDGTVEFELLTEAFTADGDPTEQIELRDGRLQLRRFLAFDDQRRPTLEEIDGDEDGLIDFRTTTTYDDVARIAVTESDRDADGTPDRRVEVERDEAGRIASQREDEPIGEPIEVIETFTYSDGLLVQISRQLGAREFLLEFTYDDEGRPATSLDQQGRFTTYTVVDCP